MKRLRIAAAALAVSLTATLLAAAPAQAEPVPEGQRLSLIPSTFNPNVGTMTTRPFEPIGMFFNLEVPEGVPFPNDATYAVSVFSCGRLIATATEGDLEANRVWFSLKFPYPARTVGPTIDTTVEVAQPGFDPYTVSFSKSDAWPQGYGSTSCENVDPAIPDYDDPVTVTQWPTKKTGTARVGRKASVTPFRTTGVGTAEMSYYWFVGRRNAKYKIHYSGSGRSIRVKPEWKGKPLFLVASIRDESWGTSGESEYADGVERVVRFGRVRN